MTDVIEADVNSTVAEATAGETPDTARAPVPAALPCGARLRAARELKGMSLADVAQRLKYATRQVQALEEGNFEALPGLTFQRGFVRGYARLVGLDAGELVAQLEREVGRDGGPTTTQLQQIAYSPTVMLSSAGRASAWPWIIGMLLAVTGIGGFALYTWDAPVPARAGGAAVRSGEGLVRSDPAPVGSEGAALRTTADAPLRAGDDAARATSAQEGSTQAPAGTGLPPAVQPNVAPAGGADTGRPIPMPQPLVDVIAPGSDPAKAGVPVSGSSGSSSATAPAGTGSGKIRLVFTGESWVEVRQGNGELVYSGTNGAGSEQWVDGQPPFDLVVGNARVVKLTYRGADINLEPYTKVTVARLQLK